MSCRLFPALSKRVILRREAQCKNIVLSIRQNEFGYGLDLQPEQEEIARKQREREGRGLQRLSQELYSKDTHFVLELIQNADDNHYPPHLSVGTSSAGAVPTLKFILSPDCVVVLNNEAGFTEQNIRAICDIGKSTKDPHRSGYIGQKGIGFKSVFRVTDAPEIHSNNFHVKFDTKSGPVGYILPHCLRNHLLMERYHRLKSKLHDYDIGSFMYTFTTLFDHKIFPGGQPELYYH